MGVKGLKFCIYLDFVWLAPSHSNKELSQTVPSMRLDGDLEFSFPPVEGQPFALKGWFLSRLTRRQSLLVLSSDVQQFWNLIRLV